MDEALELSNFLPISFKSPKEEEYIRFLWDAFETNYVHGKYQFAFMAYHMLTMSFIYFNIWQIKQSAPRDFAMGIIGFGKDVEKEFLAATSPFSFSTHNEHAILRLLKLIECDNSKIGNYVKLVDDRNSVSHTNGNIHYADQGALDLKITEVLRVASEIQAHSRSVIEACYKSFLTDSCAREERQFPDDWDQLREVLVNENYLSVEDIKYCLAFDIGRCGEDKDFEQMQQLHQSLVTEFGALAEPA